MHIHVNGEPFEVDASNARVQDLLESKELAQTPCAVEVNGKLVPKRNHQVHELSEGDRVEIVTLVGGG